MNVKGHTSSPWRWVKVGKTYLLWGEHGDRPVVLDVFKGKLRLRNERCLMEEFSPDHPDALLIEASPDLFEACEAANEAFGNPTSATAMNEARELVRLALGKAKRGLPSYSESVAVPPELKLWGPGTKLFFDDTEWVVVDYRYDGKIVNVRRLSDGKLLQHSMNYIKDALLAAGASQAAGTQPGQIKAPWTEEQVQRLNEWQQDSRFHPFTCGKCGKVLTATPNGWICGSCDYTQDWAHDFMACPPPSPKVQVTQ